MAKHTTDEPDTGAEAAPTEIDDTEIDRRADLALAAAREAKAIVAELDSEREPAPSAPSAPTAWPSASPRVVEPEHVHLGADTGTE